MNCENCKYYLKGYDELPCSRCVNMALDFFEPKDKRVI